MLKDKPTYDDLQKRVAELEFRLRQIESRDYIVKANDAELEALRVDYELVFRNTNFYVAFYKPNGDIVAYNKIASDEVGLSPDELIGKSVWDVFEKKQADLFYARMQKALSEKRLIKYEELNQTKYGKSWYEADYIPVCNENDELIGCQVIARDIGEKKNAIDELHKSEELFKSIFTQSSAGIAIANSKYEVIEANQKFADMLGYSVNEVLELKITDFSYDEELVEEKEYIKKIFAGKLDEYNIDKRYIKKNGEVFWVNLSSNVVRDEVGEVLYSVGVVIDIQDLKDTQKAFAESEDKYKLLIENQLDGVAISDKDENFTFANRAAESIFGVSEGELIGKSLKSFLSKSQKKLVLEETKKRSKGETSGYELDILRPDGDEVNLFVHAIPNINNKGEVIGTLAFFRDITAQKEAEKELEHSNYQYRTVLENTSEGVFVAKDGYVLFANEAVEKFSGYKYKEENRLSFYEIVHPDDRAFVKKNYEERLKGELIPAYDVRILTKNGEYRWAIINAVKIDWQGVPADLVFAQDIHERKMAEIELKDKKAQLEKLNYTKNRLLSIIGHDLRNPLNNINGFVYLLEQNMDPNFNSRNKKYINAIYQSSTTLTELLENLLAWSRSQTQVLKTHSETIDLCEVVEYNVNHFIHNANFKSIKLENKLEKHTMVIADKSMLHTIVRNLISNAIKFTPTEGYVVISTQQIGNYLKLNVKDSGVGLKPDTLHEILSGKPNMNKQGTDGEKGTGLGLQIINELVHLNKGELGIEESESGTNFYVKLLKGLKE